MPSGELLVRPKYLSVILKLEEYGKFTSASAAAMSLALGVSDFNKLLDRTIELTTKALGTSAFIEYGPKGVFRFADIAGILNLDRVHRIEIAPKFLTTSTEDWRDD